MTRTRQQPAQDTPGPGRSWLVLLVTALFVLVNLLVALFFLLGLGKTKRGDQNRPGPAGPGPKTDQVAYAGSASCRDCHREAYAQWEGSHHALAERPLDPMRDRPMFDPPHTFKHGSQSSDIRVAPNGRFEMVTMSRSGERQVFSPERVIGVEPLRQFLVSAAGGRYQVTEIACDPRSNLWFNIYGEEDRQPGEWGHWTGRGMNWNMMCAFCHNTGLLKNYQGGTDSYATTTVEAGVGCEACHGPMADHVRWQRPRPQPARNDPTLRPLSRDQMRDTCGACHARRSELTGTYPPGELFLDHYLLVIPDETDIYYPDGQVRDEDYEYAAFLGSRMHFSKVRCFDCHQPHSAKTKLPPDDLCLNCHRLPVLPAPRIDPATHSFHKRGEAGDHCVDCHMPQTVYMSRHWRRDHGFTIPDPLLTKELGIPNACNRCHQDKPADWSIEYVNKWYGARMERPTRQRTRTVALARAGQTAAVPALVRMAREEAIPYWRAVATLLLRRWGDETNVLQTLLAQAGDPDALVRSMAARALEPTANEGQSAAQQTLERLLGDSVRAVRVGAAWSLRRTLDTNSVAGADLLHQLAWNADQPQGLLQQAVWRIDRGQNAAALPLLQQAVKWDPYSAPLYNALAVSLSTEGRHEEALEQMRTACKVAPRDADCRFHLALALSELNRINEATAALEETVKLDPGFSRAWYNLGLALSQQGQPERALEALAKAEALEPRSAQVPYARATILARLGRSVEARAAATKALQLQPDHAEAALLLRSLP